jgi:hypothetical protein
MVDNTYKVLSIDGGGMRGLFSVAYLEGLTKLAKDRFNSDLSDLGKEFNLIVGTSTGAILGGGLAAGVPLSDIHTLYTSNGKNIFPKKMPNNKLALFFHNRAKLNKQGDDALRSTLKTAFGKMTLASLYRDRQIGLVVPAVNCTTHKAWAFKTPHDPSSSKRDDGYSLVDVCLASSAAPIYRSLASIKQPGSTDTMDIFADGGLWANNPILVALIEALRNTSEDQSIEIYCLGTSPAPAGSVIDSKNPHWGLQKWHFGGRAIELALDSQSWVCDQMAGMLLKHLNRPVSIIRFPQPSISGEQGKLLGLDNSSKQSLDLLKQLAATAVDQTNQLINSDDPSGKHIAKLIGDISNKETPVTNKAKGSVINV